MAKRSNLDKHRSANEDQDSSRHSEIVDAAEILFQEQGIVETTMIDIAKRAGVSRVTVYRHFAERDHIATEVAARMLGRLAKIAREVTTDDMGLLEATRAGLSALIDRYPETVDAHRFLAAFDNLAPRLATTEEIDREYRARSIRAFFFAEREGADNSLDTETLERLATLTHTLLGVLGRFAVNPPQEIKLDVQLQHVSRIIFGYFDAEVAPSSKSR